MTHTGFYECCAHCGNKYKPGAESNECCGLPFCSGLCYQAHAESDDCDASPQGQNESGVPK